MKDPLNRLWAVAVGSGVAAAVLLFILILPDGTPEDAAGAAALTAIGWLLTGILGTVALVGGVLLVGLTPLMTYLEKVLAKQEALERRLQKESAQRPALMEYRAPAALPEHTLE
jgi:hypothetical protein